MDAAVAVARESHPTDDGVPDYRIVDPARQSQILHNRIMSVVLVVRVASGAAMVESCRSASECSPVASFSRPRNNS